MTTPAPSAAPPQLLTVAFSKDRPMQLEATLRSFRLRCEDAASTAIGVLYKATSPESREAYREVARAFPEVVLVEERDFKRQLEELLAAADAVLFLVDDNVFVRPFSLRGCLDALAADPRALGVSLRLGRNTRRCYSLDRPQRLPALEAAAPGILRFDWPGADCDFGYPLEVSSSLYSTRVVRAALRGAAYVHPNTLEEVLARAAPAFAATHPRLLCLEQSVAFCVPANRVQTTNPNRAGDDPGLSAGALLERFRRGERIDVEALAGFVPEACHQEVALRFVGGAAPAPAAPVPAPPAPAAPARIDLRAIFEYPGRYAVLRLPAEFPGYREHSDLDVVCDDVDAFRAHVLRCAAPWVARGFRLEEHRDGPHLHLDLFRPGASRLDLRLDLAGAVPPLFPKIPVDGALTEALLAERERVVRDGVPVFVPSRRHELALRLLEYLEWQDRRPDKVKHLEHIDRANDFSFTEIVDGYTGLWARIDTDRGQARLDVRPKSIQEAASLAELRGRPRRKRRMDYFMIWGHGLAHAEEMVSAIREHPAFRVVAIVKRRVDDVARFVERVYEADTVPLEHLAAKTRYLLGTPPEILFVLVENLDAQEQYFGEGAFRHVQCRNVKAVKEQLRDRFNPRRGGRRTEDHVVHGSDYEAQVRHLLAVLGLPPVEHFRREPNPRLDAPYHLPPFERFDVRELPLASLRARILGRGDVPIEETPHFRHLAGDREAYRAYHAAHLGVELLDDHFPAAFDRLAAEFDPDRTEHEGRLQLILATPIGDGTFRIVDGVHRAALLAQRGRTTVRIGIPCWTATATPTPTATATPTSTATPTPTSISTPTPRRRLDVLFCGLARTPELLARSLSELDRLRGGDVVGRILFSTWHGEIDRQPGLRARLARHGVELVESRLPEPSGTSHIWAQMRSLELGLAALSPDALVLKTRADVHVDPRFVERLADERLLEPEPDAASRRDLVFERKVWVPWFEISKPFYLGDECFCGTARDLRLLVNYDVRYDVVFPLDAGVSHVRRFAHPFLERHPALLAYLEHAGRTGHFTPERFAILRASLESELFLGLLAVYYHLLVANFRVEGNAFPGQITFREWSSAPVQPEPSLFLENFRPDRSWTPRGGHLFAYDERWVRNVLCGRLPASPQLTFVAEALARLRAGPPADLAAWLAPRVEAHLRALAGARAGTALSA